MSKVMFRRYLLFCVSLFVNALGIAFITKAALGTSPITSVTYVLSMFTPFTIGQWTIMLNLLFVVIEPFLMSRQDLKSDLHKVLQIRKKRLLLQPLSRGKRAKAMTCW